MGALREWVEKLWGRPSEGPATLDQVAVDFLAHVRPFQTGARLHQRYPCRLPMTLWFGEASAVALACDISMSGLGVRTTMPLAVGIKVLARLGAAGSHLRLPAKVVWSRAQGRVIGAGLCFESDTAGTHRDAVQALVRRVSAGLGIRED